VSASKNFILKVNPVGKLVEPIHLQSFDWNMQTALNIFQKIRACINSLQTAPLRDHMVQAFINTSEEDNALKIRWL
jgi:hypothetical protein